MCGIAGAVSLDGHQVPSGPVERMVTALAHRGPDGHGVHAEQAVALGHRRLSILDPTPAGAQPMLRGRLALVHNGEVYNYLELAQELRALGHNMISGTDTEMILAAYEAWGLEAVERFNGMFAFALWDGGRRRLILVRDRMGVKPLYIRRTQGSVVFASEPQAIVAAGRVDDGDIWLPQPDLGVVRDFLERGATDRTDRTFYDGITSVAPGHMLVVEEGRLTPHRYWVPPALADDARATVRGEDLRRDAALLEEFGALFDSSVRLRLRADVPLGSCLSGGLDSSAIVSSIARLREAGVAGHGNEQMPSLAFHARFPEYGIDESRFAELVAKQSGVRLIHRTPAGLPLLHAIVPVLRSQGEPYGGASINAQYAVMEAAHAEQLKVMLDGQGADELLGGYNQFLGIRTAGLLRRGSPVAAAHEMRGQVSEGTLGPAAAIALAVRGTAPVWALEFVRAHSGGRFGFRPGVALRAASIPEDVADLPGTLLARRLWRSLASESLPALLRYEDRNSMAFAVEARVPFMDVRLVELAVRLPDRLRVNRGVTKVILRKAMAGRVPQEVLDRRDKLGFVAPQRAWLAASIGEVGPVLRDGQVVYRGWAVPEELERVLASAQTDRRASEQLWRLLIIELWLRLGWPGETRIPSRVWDAAVVADHHRSLTAASA